MIKKVIDLLTLVLFGASVFVIVDYNFWAGIALIAAAACIRYYFGTLGKSNAISKSKNEKTAAND